MPNDEIAIGMDATEAVVANAISEHSFRVVGYYSKGCEVIAEIIEAELKIGPAFGPKSQKLSSLSKPELTGEIAKVIASNKTRRWKAEDIRTKILEQNPGRTTSAKTIEKNLVYDQLLIF